MCSGKQILVSCRILMAVSLEPVLQHSRERRKEEGLLEWMGASVSSGPAAPDLVLAFQKQEEKKKEGFRQIPFSEKIFLRSSSPPFLKYCSSIIVTVCSSGRAMK